MKYLVLILIVAVSCKSTSTNNKTLPIEDTQSVFEETSRELTDKRVIVKLKNTSQVSQRILNPMENDIMRNVNGEWEKVSVLYCDCGGPPCPAPPNERSVEASGVFTFSWDMLIEECKSDQGGRTTVKEMAPRGDYRAIYRFIAEGSTKTQNMIIEFSID